MKVCIVASEGGHLTEIMMLKSVFEKHDFYLVSYDYPRIRDLPYKKYMLPLFTRNVWNLIPAFWIAWKSFRRERPQVVMTTGSEVAIPVFLLAKVFGAQTIFIETIVRFDKGSLTGKLLYHLCDKFYVQNRETLQAYGSKAEYHGGVI